MAYASKTLRDWVVAALTASGTLPTPTEGAARQLESMPAVGFTYGNEEVEAADSHEDLERNLAVEIHCIAGDYDAVDALALGVELAIDAAIATYPGTAITLQSRTYSEEVESDVRAVECILEYGLLYYTTESDPESLL